MTYTIGQLAKRFGLTLRALRFYEQKELISPARRGTTRLYSDTDVHQVGLIAAWTRAGFNLTEIRLMLALDAKRNHKRLNAHIAERLQEFEGEIDERLAAIQRLRSGSARAAA